jgi:hypothetical protein
MPHFLHNKYISLIKRHFVVTHTICQTEILHLHSSVTNTSSIKLLCPQKHCLMFYFHKNITCWSVGLLRISQVLSVCCKIVYWWVTKNCCFMSDILAHKCLHIYMVSVTGRSEIICCIQVSDVNQHYLFYTPPVFLIKKICIKLTGFYNYNYNCSHWDYSYKNNKMSQLKSLIR